MSFFDEADEPQQPPRTETRRPRSGPRSSGGRGDGRPPASNQQQIQTRRLALLAVVVIVVILMAVLIHGCESTQATNSLKSYNNDVSRLITRSDTNGSAMFHALQSGNGSTASGAQTMQNDVLTAYKQANTELTDTKDLSVPSQMSQAQQNLVLVMTQRRDGIHQVAENLQRALNHDTSKDGVYALTVGTSLLYSSDVVYKAYVGPEIAEVLHSHNITVCPANASGSCGADSVTINPGQIVPDLGWLQASFIAAKLNAPVSSLSNPSCPSGQLCGSSLNSVSVGGTALVAGTTNDVQANPAPTFTLNVTNGGVQTQNLTCRVSIQGVSDSASGSLPNIASGSTQDCTVKLPHPPPSGSFTVTAKVDKVPGETNVANNTATYTVNFS